MCHGHGDAGAMDKANGVLYSAVLQSESQTLSHQGWTSETGLFQIFKSVFLNLRSTLPPEGSHKYSNHPATCVMVFQIPDDPLCSVSFPPLSLQYHLLNDLLVVSTSSG